MSDRFEAFFYIGMALLSGALFLLTLTLAVLVISVALR